MKKRQPILKRLGERGFIFDAQAHRFYYTESESIIKQYLNSPIVRMEPSAAKRLKLEAII